MGLCWRLATLLTLRGCDDGSLPGWLLGLLWRLAAWLPYGVVVMVVNLADWEGVARLATLLIEGVKTHAIILG
jgi:hypothetical protein